MAPEPSLHLRNYLDRSMAKLLVRALLIPVVALTVFFITPFDDQAWILSAGLGIMATVIGVPYAVHRIVRIRRSVHPLAEALAVISLLLSLIVVGFAGSYYSMSLHTDQFPGIHTRVDALYFTIVTIGTVGYGDIVPTGQQARLMVSLQIMLNLTLIATVVRLLGRIASSNPNRPEERLAQMEGTSPPSPGPAGASGSGDSAPTT